MDNTKWTREFVCVYNNNTEEEVMNLRESESDRGIGRGDGGLEMMLTQYSYMEFSKNTIK